MLVEAVAITDGGTAAAFEGAEPSMLRRPRSRSTPFPAGWFLIAAVWFSGFAAGRQDSAQSQAPPPQRLFGEARIEHLTQQLASRGRTLFAGNGAQFMTRLALPSDNGGIAPGVSRHAYRIAVEALHNAARHAHAGNIQLGLAAKGKNGQLRLWVQDDGRGIDTDTLSEPGGMGLITMRRRAEVIGGTLTVESRPGSGTRIELDFDPHGRRGDRTWWRAVRLPMRRGTKLRG